MSPHVGRRIWSRLIVKQKANCVPWYEKKSRATVPLNPYFHLQLEPSWPRPSSKGKKFVYLQSLKYVWREYLKDHHSLKRRTHWWKETCILYYTNVNFKNIFWDPFIIIRDFERCWLKGIFIKKAIWWVCREWSHSTLTDPILHCILTGKLKCAHSPLNLRILTSLSDPFTLMPVQVSNCTNSHETDYSGP